MSLQVIALSSGFAKRNVQEAASALRAGGFAFSRMIGNEQQFRMPREPWLALLGLERLPLHEEWPQLFAGVPFSPAGPSGEEYWSHFTSAVRALPLGLHPSASK